MTATFPLLRRPHLAAAWRLIGALLLPAATGPAQARPRGAVRLEPGQMWSQSGLQGATLICRSGCLWLAHDRGRRELVLQPGDRHHVDSDRRLVAQAMLAVEMEVVESARS